MAENKFGWRVGDGLRWSSPEGRDKSCVVIKATAVMIEFETEEGDVKRVKGNNPGIVRIDGPPEAGSELVSEPEMALEMTSETLGDTLSEGALQEACDFEAKAEAALVSPAAERVSEREAELDLKSGGVEVASIQLREGEGGALRAGDQEFRIAPGGEWHPSLEEALDSEYGKSWMCIRWRDSS
jgi:hypothetical protein